MEQPGSKDLELSVVPRYTPANGGSEERRPPLGLSVIDPALGQSLNFPDVEPELGPLEPLMQDPTVTDILVDNHEKVYVERHGKLESTDVRFKDEAHLRKIIDRVLSAVGRRVDEACPMADARTMDGSRVNVIVPPLAIDGSLCANISETLPTQ